MSSYPDANPIDPNRASVPEEIRSRLLMAPGKFDHTVTSALLLVREQVCGSAGGSGGGEGSGDGEGAVGGGGSNGNGEGRVGGGGAVGGSRGDGGVKGAGGGEGTSGMRTYESVLYMPSMNVLMHTLYKPGTGAVWYPYSRVHTKLETVICSSVTCRRSISPWRPELGTPPPTQ